MKNIILLLRAPFIDRIPSLKTLVLYLADHGFRITIISSRDKQFPEMKFDHPNIRTISVAQRTRRFGLPTSVKLIVRTVLCYLHLRPVCMIGGDYIGNQILTKLARVFHFQHINFLLEYPDIDNKDEVASLAKAKYIITHDNWHGKFLMENCGVEQEQLLYLPNASYTSEFRDKTTYLHDRLGIAHHKRIILHSGGLGAWFECKQLARSTSEWPDGTVLVFHTSHHIDKEPYYKEMTQEDYRGKVLFSTSPVDNSELDSLNASAHIGAAIYSVEELGYRATYMGLAAGKIGNYLKCGIPVIATDLPSLDYIVNYQCGELVKSHGEIPGAIERINRDYDSYVRNAYKCYRELWHPQQYLETITTALHTLTDKQ